MSQPDLAAARPPCTCRERDHLEGELQKSRDLVGKLDASSERVSDERDTLLEQVATLRAELECIEASAPQIHGDGKTRERSWGASYPLDRVRKLLADTAAAAAAYRQQIERETLNTATDGRFAKIEQQAREQEREAVVAILDRQIQVENEHREQSVANSNWRDAEIADHRRLALLAAYDEFQAADRARGGEPAPARETTP